MPPASTSTSTQPPNPPPIIRAPITLGIPAARRAERGSGGLTLAAPLVVRRGGQLMADPAVGEDPGEAAIGKRHLLVAHRAAIQQDGITASRLQCREWIHDPGVRADEA